MKRKKREKRDEFRAPKAITSAYVAIYSPNKGEVPMSTISDLKEAYWEATKGGLMDFILTLRNESTEKYSKKINELYLFFEKMPLWKLVPSKDGHYTFKHKVTHIVIGFQAHSRKKKDNTVSATLVKSIRDNVQKHLNMLGNEIFSDRKFNWKSEPDYKASAVRYRKLMHLPEEKAEGKSKYEKV